MKTGFLFLGLLLSPSIPLPGAEARVFVPSAGTYAAFTVTAHAFGKPVVVYGIHRHVEGEVQLLPAGRVSAHLSMAGDGFKTGILQRDRDVAHSLSEKDHPDLVFALMGVSGYHPERDSPQDVTLTGRLEVRGRATTLSIPARIRVRGRDLEAEGSVDTRFSSLKVSPPGLLGLLSTEDPLRIGLVLKAKERERPGQSRIAE
jgi:hypothetical protein